MTTQTQIECANCGKLGPIAEDETWPGDDEMACDARGLVALSRYVCGECLDTAETAAKVP